VIKSFVDYLGLDSNLGDVLHACLDVGTLTLGDVEMVNHSIVNLSHLLCKMDG
jgi:hypothetical protein